MATFLLTHDMTDTFYQNLRTRMRRHGYTLGNGTTFIVADWNSYAPPTESIRVPVQSVIDGKVARHIQPYIGTGRHVLLLTGTTPEEENLARGIGAKRALAVAVTRSLGLTYCTMIDDNIELMIFRPNTVCRVRQGSCVTTVGIPQRLHGSAVVYDTGKKTAGRRLEEAEQNLVASYPGMRFGFRMLSTYIQQCAFTDPDVVVAGCTRFEHSGEEREGKVDPDNLCAAEATWSIYKFLVLNVERLPSGVNFDPQLTALGEDVLLYSQLVSYNLEPRRLHNFYVTYVQYTDQEKRSYYNRAEPVRANADKIIEEYFSNPMLHTRTKEKGKSIVKVESVSKDKMKEILKGKVLFSGAHSYLTFGNIIVRQSSDQSVIFPDEFPVNVYTNVFIPKKPGSTENLTALADAAKTEKVVYEKDAADDPFLKYSPCGYRNDDYLTLTPQNSTVRQVRGTDVKPMLYNLCPPTEVTPSKSPKYESRWRFLVLYAMVKYAYGIDSEIMKKFINVMYQPELQMTFNTDILDSYDATAFRQRCRFFTSPGFVRINKEKVELTQDMVRCTKPTPQQVRKTGEERGSRTTTLPKPEVASPAPKKLRRK